MTSEIINGTPKIINKPKETYINEGRGYDYYRDVLDLPNISELGDILDLGASINNTVLDSTEVQSHRRNGFNFISTTAHSPSDLNISRHKTTIQALADALPFRDKSFNTILAVVSVPFHLTPLRRTMKEIDEKYLEEVFRILKHGGEAYFFPVPIQKDERGEWGFDNEGFWGWPEGEDVYSRYWEIIAKVGFSIESSRLEFVNKKEGSQPKYYGRLVLKKL